MKTDNDSSRPDTEMTGNDQTEFNGRPLTNRRPQGLSTRIESETLGEGRCHEENVKGKALLDRTVRDLNAEARREARSWLVMGEVVKTFIKESQKAEGDCFKQLEAHPDIIIQSNQLRNYHAAFLLWEKIGQHGVPPEVSHTHFVAVLGSNLNFQDKLTLLQRAEKKGWSVSRLKQAIKDHMNGGGGATSGGGGQPKGSIPIDYNTACSRLSDLAAKTMAQITLIMSGAQSPSVTAETKEKLRGLVRLLLFHRLVDRGFVEKQLAAVKETK